MLKRVFVTVLTLLVFGCAPKLYRVPSGNMEPTIKPGDHVLTDEVYYSKHSIQRFDIVLFKAAEATKSGDFEVGEKELWCHRVVGLGGEVVEIKKGQVFVNGQALREPFKIMPSDDDFGPVSVPAGELFILGDNRPNSADSRYWPDPTVSEKAVTAKIIQVIPQ
ncbi:MAG: signal peptidase I [Pyrinomonadaceae bacterium]